MKVKIKPGRYPYLSARIRTRRSRLLCRVDYEKMMKMDIHTMIKFLEDRGFGFEDIDEKNIFESVESSVNRNLEKELSSLLRISQGSSREILYQYLKRFDIQNVRLIIRAKMRDYPLEMIEPLWICAGAIDSARLKSIWKSDAKKALSELKLFTDDEIKKLAREFDEGKTAKIENAIVGKYYSSIASSLKGFKGEGRLVERFVDKRLDAINIRTLYKLKRKGARKDDIMPLFSRFGSISRGDIEGLAGLELGEMHTRLSARVEALKEAKIGESLGDIDARLETDLLRFSEKLMHAHPLSTAPLIAYIVMKEAEGRNIKLIAHAKYYGVDEETIRKNLAVMPS